MTRATIDVGIDLGTTNSAIAALVGGEPTPLRNNENQEITPSAVMIDRDGTLTVGTQASLMTERRPRAVAREFKRAMGTETIFDLSGHQRTPEQLSAEVLRTLRLDAEARLSEEVRAAAITVPAMFTLAACEATTRAANLAGFDQVELLQEPIAAGIAFGVASGGAGGYWVVYDFGGGTFDAALLSIRDGRLQVVDHVGDDLLGGKNLDETLLDYVVDQLRTRHGYRIEGIVRRGEGTRQKLYAILKQECERAKIRMTREETARVEAEGAEDDLGQEIEAGVTLTRATYEELISPLVGRTTRLVRDLLARNSLDARGVQRIILVGGPTVTPYIRHRIHEDIGAELETRPDPMTIVSLGAALYAGTILRRRESLVSSAPASAQRGAVPVELKYEPVSEDIEALVGGVIREAATEGSAIEIERTDGGWASGRIPLRDGKFVVTVALRPRQTSSFTLRITDPSGQSFPTAPAEFTISNGLVVDGPPLSRDLGVAVESSDSTHGVHTEVMLRRGTRLPARARHTFRTTRLIAPGAPSGVELHLVEGEAAYPDRNDHVGFIRLDGTNIHRAVPAGSDVEVTITVDRSRKISVRGYVPVLEQDFALTIEEGKRPVPDMAIVARGLRVEQERLARLAQVGKMPDVDEAVDVLAHTVDEARRGDPDAALRAARDLHALQEKLDRAEQGSSLLLVQQEWNELLPEARETLTSAGEPDDRQQMLVLEREWREALAAGSVAQLWQKVEQLRALHYRALMRRPEFWIGLFNHLVTLQSEMADVRMVQALIQQGRTAIDRNDLESLRTASIQLLDLLPDSLRGRVQSAYGRVGIRT